MSATVMMTSSTESQTVTATGTATKLDAEIEVEFAKCDCCGLREECTIGYIDRIRERYQGKWICGLCAEAVKDEIVRCERLISTEEALTLHMNLCKKFNSAGPPPNPTVHLISAMRQILRRSLESPPRTMRSVPCSPKKNSVRIDRSVLSRAGSCIPNLSLVDSSSFSSVDEGTQGSE